MRAVPASVRRAMVLPTIGALFLASALLRVWDGVAHAREDVAVDGAEVPATEARLSPAADPDATGEETCLDTPGFAAALATVLERESRVAALEESLAERQSAVEMAEEGARLQLALLQEAEDSLRATMAASETAAEDDLSRLTSVYENMKPKEAAALFAQMAPEFAAGFLSRMRPDAAAGILSGLEPTRAYAISVLMAGRNAAAPVE